MKWQILTWLFIHTIKNLVFKKEINSLKNLELYIISASFLNNAPNNLVGCVIQKR